MKREVVEKAASDTNAVQDNVITEVDRKFQAEYNPDNGTVCFQLTDGTEVVMREPKAKQLLLLDSFIKQAEPEYKTEAFLAIKLISLCIIKYNGKEGGVKFETLLDTLSFDDMGRLVEALAHFRDVFEDLAERANI